MWTAKAELRNCVPPSVRTCMLNVLWMRWVAWHMYCVCVPLSVYTYGHKYIATHSLRRMLACLWLHIAVQFGRFVCGIRTATANDDDDDVGKSYVTKILQMRTRFLLNENHQKAVIRM